jgi:hypothetical protein
MTKTPAEMDARFWAVNDLHVRLLELTAGMEPEAVALLVVVARQIAQGDGSDIVDALATAKAARLLRGRP